MAGRYAANRYSGYIPVGTTGVDTGGGEAIFRKTVIREVQVEKPLPTIRLAKAPLYEKKKDIKVIVSDINLESDK